MGSLVVPEIIDDYNLPEQGWMHRVAFVEELAPEVSNFGDGGTHDQNRGLVDRRIAEFDRRVAGLEEGQDLPDNEGSISEGTVTQNAQRDDLTGFQLEECLSVESMVVLLLAKVHAMLDEHKNG